MVGGRPDITVHQTADQAVVIGPGIHDALVSFVGEHTATDVGVLASQRALNSALGAACVAALTAAGVSVRTCADVPTHTTLDAVRHASAMFDGVDAVVAIGGGSASDLAKAVAADLVADDITRYFIRRRPDGTVEDHRLPAGVVPVIAVPTTLSAAEITCGAGVTDGGLKHVLWDPSLAASAVFYDTSERQQLPDAVAVSTGMNAIAHCVEATYSGAGGPVADAVALGGLETLARALPGLVRGTLERPDALRDAFAGAAVSGQALRNGRVCLHHALVHVLGAATHADHGDLNSVLLSHVADFNRSASTEAQDRCVGALRRGAVAAGVDLPDAPLGDVLRAFTVAIDAPQCLGEVGAGTVDLDAVWDALTVERGLAFNPLPVARDDAEAILRAAGATFESGVFKENPI